MKNQLWFSILSSNAHYTSDEPDFFSNEQFEWTKNSNTIAQTIRQELSEYLKEHHLQVYFNTTMSDNIKKWKTISLKWWGLEFYSRQKHFPKTTTFINSIPHLVSASFNLLEANSKIYPHCGDTNGIYRCHLGLIIPAGLPNCGFRVANSTRAWREGEWLIFTDAKEHEAWNNTHNNRFILLIDVIRPEYIAHKNKITLVSLTGLFLQKLAEKFPFLYRFQNHQIIKKTLVFILLPFCFMAIKMRNLLSRLNFLS